VSLLRYKQTRRADDVDDQADSAEITQAIPNSVTQEDYQRYFLSRLRQVIFGDAAGKHWFDDFEGEGIKSLSELSAGVTGDISKIGIVLIGAKNGTNRIYHTPDKFFHDPLVTGSTIEVFANSRRLIQTNLQNPAVGDYWVSESGGVGTGFDTINLLTFTPIVRTTLVCNYLIA